MRTIAVAGRRCAARFRSSAIESSRTKFRARAGSRPEAIFRGALMRVSPFVVAKLGIELVARLAYLVMLLPARADEAIQ